LLHIKDGPIARDVPMTAVGDGKMNWPPIMEAAGANMEWLVTELDSCATDMFAAVEKSARFLIDHNMAQPR
jgi:sugar phosphate isomerase/epimerase